MISVLVGIVVAMFPRRYRMRRLELHGNLYAGGVLGGLLESALSFGLFVQSYFYIFTSRADELSQIIVHSGREGVTSLHLHGAHFSALMEFMMRPSSLVMIYFVFEGVLRALAAFVTGESVPILPLAMVGWLHQSISSGSNPARLVWRLADEVQIGPAPDFELRIATCRPKENWHELMTIAYDERLYEVVREERGSKPRPFIYYLRLRPESKLIRGIHHYTPEEALAKN